MLRVLSTAAVADQACRHTVATADLTGLGGASLLQLQGIMCKGETGQSSVACVHLGHVQHGVLLQDMSHSGAELSRHKGRGASEGPVGAGD